MNRNVNGAVNAGAPVFALSVRTVFWTSSAVVALLFLASLAPTIAELLLGFDRRTGLLRMVSARFDVNRELTISTWFASSLLFVCALLLGYIAQWKWRFREPYYVHWAGLAMLFLGMSADEATALHERTGQFLPERIRTESIYGWTVIGGSAVLLTVLIFYRFFINLPEPTRGTVALAALLYVGGALGLELVAGMANHSMGHDVYVDSYERVALTHAEELMEFAGTIVFLCALLRYIEVHGGGIRVSTAPWHAATARVDSERAGAQLSVSRRDR